MPAGDEMTLFKQFFHPPTAILSYLVADPVTRAAALIDPAPGVLETCGRLLGELGLRLTLVLETHARADGDMNLPELRAETGARLAAHASAPTSGCDQRLRDGDRLYLGEEAIEVIHTPGATPCSVTYRWNDRLFTGDTLWIGCAGDLSGQHADPAALYDSVHRRLFSLPDEYLVYPGHDWTGNRVSCVGQEKLTNSALRAAREAFLAARLPDRQPP
ncbi:MAG: MBL fold metallo-hydrolase [Gammaproteobacteria bacterium]